ncbi:hypothetical protein [Cellulosimicrobium sp. 22601]|uniref:hypothetical protein n=1 Tax=unclassified Cellulosimicrobium TaxID=2624466 RepID=UPI003F8749DC
MGRDRPEAIPLFHTPRNPNRETTGRQKAGVARAMGRPFIPWQQDVADVWGEIDPHTGTYWYDTLVLIGLRQIGKTTFTIVEGTETGLFYPDALIRYTAQTKGKAASRLEDEFWKILHRSPLEMFLDHNYGRRTNKPGWDGTTGEEAIRFTTGAKWEVEALKEESGHGPSLTKGIIDEAFAHLDGRVEQAMRPAMQTIEHAQLIIASAAGHSKSLYLRARQLQEEARFRSLVEQYGPLGPTRARVCFVQYALPTDMDPDDPASWWYCHPGLGWLTTEAKLAAAHEAAQSDPWEFYRPYLGWWPEAKRDEWVIPEASLRGCFEPDEDLDWSGSPVYGIDVAPDRSVATIAIAAGAPNTRAWVEVPRQDVGTAWVVDAARRMRDGSSKAEPLGGRLVVLDGAGPAASLAPDLRRAGFEVVELGARELNAACGALFDDVVQTNLTHSGDPELYAAVKAAVKAPSGDSWRWGRKRSLEDITALYAVTLARHGYVTRAPADYDPAASVVGPTKEDA